MRIYNTHTHTLAASTRSVPQTLKARSSLGGSAPTSPGLLFQGCRKTWFVHNMGASINRIGSGGIVYYKYNKEPPKIV